MNSNLDSRFNRLFWCFFIVLIIITPIFTQTEIQIPELTTKPDKALLVIIKPSEILGDTTNNYVIKLKYVKPGIVSLMSNDINKKSIDNDFKAGSIYYILNPKDAESQKYLGDILYKNGNNPGALQAYRIAFNKDSTIHGIYNNYAVLLSEKGNPDVVLKMLRNIIAKGEANVSTHLALGKIYQRKNNHQEAIEIFEKIISDTPNDYHTLYALAISYQKMGNLNNAITTMQKCVSTNKNADNEYKTLGELYEKVHNTDEAMKAYGEYIDKKGNDQTIIFKLGTFYHDKGKFKEAEKYLSMVSGKNKNGSTYVRMLANCYFNNEKYKKAISQYKKVNAKKPSLTVKKESYKKLAESYLKLNQSKNALFWFEKFSKINKGKDKDISYLKAFLYEKSNPTKAKQLYTLNTKTFPRDHRNFLRLGLILSKNAKSRTQSVSLLERATEIADTIPSVWLEIAKVYEKLKKSEKALNAYTRYLSMDSEDIAATIQISTLLMEQNRESDALPYLEKAHVKEPKNARTILMLADCYIRTGRENDALSLLEKAKETQINNIEIQKKLIDVYVKVGKDQELLAQIEQLLAKKRDNPTLLLYAQLLLKSNRKEDTKNTVEDILATEPDNIEALMISGSLYILDKKYEKAHETYNEIGIIDNKYASAYYEKAELYLLQSKPLWAAKYYKKALRANPNFALAFLGLGKIALLHKKQSEYRTQVEKAYSLDPGNELIKQEYTKLR